MDLIYDYCENDELPISFNIPLFNNTLINSLTIKNYVYIDELPSLPINCRELNIIHCQFRDYCKNNQDGFPKNLEYLYSDYNIHTISFLDISLLPNTCKKIIFVYTSNIHIPTELLNSVEYFEIIQPTKYLLTDNLYFSNNLKVLKMYNIKITYTWLLHLPDNLEILSLINCNMIDIPKLPKNLKEFDCSENDLIYLDILPSSLINLKCQQNYKLKFVYIDNLCNLKYIECDEKCLINMLFINKYKIVYIQYNLSKALIDAYKNSSSGNYCMP